MSEDKKVPYSEDAEQAVLAAVFHDNAALAKSAEVIDESMFYRESHRRIYRAMLALSNRGDLIDPLTVIGQLDSSGELEASGGKDYVGYLLDVVPGAANIGAWSRIVADKFQRRKLIELGQRLMSEAREKSTILADLARTITGELLPVATEHHKRGFVDAAFLAQETIDAIRKAMDGEKLGFTTGYDEIDKHTGGYLPGDLIFVCGVPGSAKTALALNKMRRATARGVECAFISAEMPRVALGRRLLALDIPISVAQMRKGDILREEDGRWIGAGIVSMRGLPFHVDDTPTPDIALISARCRALKAKHPKLGIIYLDFIQLVQAKTEGDNRSLQLTEISYKLKGLAKELEVAVVATCQVDASEVEKRSDRRPQLRDMRWSQAMREAGDMIILVYREGQYDPHARSSLELNFAKARDLAPFKVELEWVGQYMRINEFPRAA